MTNVKHFGFCVKQGHYTLRKSARSAGNKARTTYAKMQELVNPQCMQFYSRKKILTVVPQIAQISAEKSGKNICFYLPRCSPRLRYSAPPRETILRYMK
jgi:hypothetical protein